MRKIFIFTSLLLFVACNAYRPIAEVANVGSDVWKTRVLPASPQDISGDPEAGFDYLIHGDYIGSGVPIDIMRSAAKRMTKEDPYARNKLNEGIPYNMTGFVAPNGTEVANGNCFTCHAGHIGEELVIGMGESWSDYEKSMVLGGVGMRTGMALKYKKDDPEYKAWEDFGNYFKVMAPRISVTQPGANPAFRLAEACMMHRDPEDLTFTEEPQFEMWDYNIGTDTPPLWHVKKKNTLYYTGIGRGSMPKLLLQASVLGVPDSAQSRKSVEAFKDVYAWLLTLEAPKYPKAIDQSLAAAGKPLFTEHCSGCHGTYGATDAEDTYPNKVVHLDVIKTDRLYSDYIQQSGIVDWYNKSWFATSEPKSAFVPNVGYVAPPLDGVWASAPYFHNGSVPTLYEVLHSDSRPARWTRSGDPKDVDWKKMGWAYDPEPKNKKWTFDTSEPGYSNVGHYFGDKLSEEERWAVVEYLKTL
ncbi:c-type cytochrome [Lewinella sp. 4G2]|uniref:c-type cytochrome n=1 Tax=Lewinella sp. 4G2 TaxID=1803372 RepID=UPI0007B4AFE8|nr:c-type cytochrome [Lewinella sp. 4G2]OAV43720.1 hypothetical protein A3850_004050 [Lewinella sp. 4G2]